MGYGCYRDEVNFFNCHICSKQNCLLCKAIHEGMNCQEYQDDLKRQAAGAVVDPLILEVCILSVIVRVIIELVTV